MHLDLVILDELVYLPCSPAGGTLLPHRHSKLYENASAVITTNLVSGELAHVLVDPKMTTKFVGQLTHHYCIVDTGNES